MNHEMHEQWARDRVDAYLDGDLPVRDRVQFEAALETSGELRAEVALARRVQSALRALPQRDVPAGVLTAAQREAAIAASPPARRHRPLWPWTTALAAAAAVLVTVAILRDVNAPVAAPPVPAPPAIAINAAPEPTAEELAAARDDLMMTFAYLGAVQRRGAAVAGAAVLDEGITPPLRTAIDALNLLNLQQPPEETGKELSS